MAIMQADNPLIEKELYKIEALIEEGGGGTHSDLIIYSENGAMAAKTKGPMAQGKEIIRLSRDTLLPSDKYVVKTVNNDFQVEFPRNSTLSQLQRRLAESMIVLYNLTRKPDIQRQYSFLLSLIDYPELLEKIGTGRAIASLTPKWHEDVKKGMTGEILNDYLASSFLKTRHLGYNDHIRTSSVSILMPIIDVLNHHWVGSSYRVHEGVRKGDIMVQNQQPIEGSLECFAFYNIMDSFDALMRYDFIDEYAPIVRSAPLELPVEDRGKIIFKNLPAGIVNKKLSEDIADLARFMPTTILNDDKTLLEVSHLLIPVEGSPHALRRVLLKVLTDFFEKQPEVSFFEPWIRDAEVVILDKNIEYYQDLLKFIDKLGKDKGESAGLQRMRDLCNLQLAKLAKYKHLPPPTA